LELSGYEVEHGQEVSGGAVAAGFALGGGEQAVESLHKSVGQTGSPMGEDSLTLRLGDKTTSKVMTQIPKDLNSQLSKLKLTHLFAAPP
jgi:hypothetical protein